tara:strand:- start:67 stop:1023 length:957 start_codon:yes stop_codon:yes gene_type:complete
MASILNVTPITDVAQFPIKKGTLQFLQDAHKDSLANTLIGMIGDSFNALNVYVLYGCKNTGSFPAYNISSGAIFFLGEVYGVNSASFSVTGSNVAVLNIATTQYTTDADPVTFTDAVARNVHDVRSVVISAGASGSGIGNYSAIIFDAVRFPQATETVKGVSEIATQGETEAGLNDTNIVTPAKLEGSYGMVKSAWTLRSDIADLTYTVVGIGVTVSQCNIKYKIIGKTMHIAYYAVVTNSVNAPTAFKLLIPESKSANLGFDYFSTGQMFDAGAFVNCVVGITNAAPTFININPASGVVLTNPSTTTLAGSITFEIA